jgi:hypothetical protein
VLVKATGKNRYLLLIDILGFSEICKTKDSEEIYYFVNELLENGELWEKRDLGFNVLYFSDTILLYQNTDLPIHQAFMDLYFIASRIYVKLLSQNIPVRGAITYGKFFTKQNKAQDKILFYGKALVDAAKLEKEKKWLGISISNEAIECIDKDDDILKILFPEIVYRKDKIYLLNPFSTLRTSFGGITIENLQNDNEYQEEINALQFIKKQSLNNTLEDDIKLKYNNTIGFLKNVFEKEMFPMLWKCFLD